MSSVTVELVVREAVHTTAVDSALTVGGTALATIIETMADATSHAEGA